MLKNSISLKSENAISKRFTLELSNFQSRIILKIHEKKEVLIVAQGASFDAMQKNIGAENTLHYQKIWVRPNHSLPDNTIFTVIIPQSIESIKFHNCTDIEAIDGIVGFSNMRVENNLLKISKLRIREIVCQRNTLKLFSTGTSKTNIIIEKITAENAEVVLLDTSHFECGNMGVTNDLMCHLDRNVSLKVKTRGSFENLEITCGGEATVEIQNFESGDIHGPRLAQLNADDKSKIICGIPIENLQATISARAILEVQSEARTGLVRLQHHGRCTFDQKIVSKVIVTEIKENSVL